MKGRKWLKRSCIGLLLFCFMCLLLPAASITSLAATQEVSGNLYSVSGDNTYQLSGPTTISNQMQVSSGTVNIDLHGQTLTMQGGNAYFMISPNATLNIYDSVGGGRINLGTYLIWMYNGGAVNLGSEESGKNGPFTIDGTNENAPQMGGAICMYSPMQGDEIVNMYAGVTIQNCKASQYGGAIYVGDATSGNKCVFNMYGGTLQNNHAPDGGAIYIGSYQGNVCSAAHLKGKSKISIKNNTADRKGSAIYNNGDLEISGVLDIDDQIYLARNNFEGLESYPSYIRVTDHLVVVGDGYIDVDTNYPHKGTSDYTRKALCGNTVVYNAAQNKISHEEFYTYASYFVNTTRNLSVSAGFDPQKNSCTESAGPGGWWTSNSDDNHDQNYIDVMGQTMHVNALSRPGSRQSQDWNYLIYTERSNPSDPMREFYSIKLIKKDESGKLLNGAAFLLNGTSDQTNPDLKETSFSANSGSTGEDIGVNPGETYIYSSEAKDEKLMIDDGTYTISETTAPDGFTARQDAVATIRITHEMDGNISVSVVYANGSYKLSDQETTINNVYNDKGQLVNKEIVLTIVNTQEPEPIVKWKISGIKNGQIQNSIFPLSGAEFKLYKDGTTDDTWIGTAISADGNTAYGDTKPSKGTLVFTSVTNGQEDVNGYAPVMELEPGTYYLREIKAPQGYGTIRMIRFTISDNEAVIQQMTEEAASQSAGETDDGSYAAADGIATADNSARTIAFTLTDAQIARLPSTGTGGYFRIALLAIILMAGSGMACVWLSQMRRQR